MSIYTTITASLPFIEVDLNLTPQQMSMFINGLKYIIPCQSRFSGKSIEQLVNERYQSISTTVKNCLKDHRIPTANQRAEEAFQALRCILHELQSKKLSKKLGKRAKREYNIVQSIRCLLRNRSDIVIRRTDKSKVFYIGKATDFARKAEEYMLKTKAYQEITNGRCPLADMLHAVQTLLASFVKQGALTKQQSNKISPNLNKLELAPIFLNFARRTTFINGIDVTRKLEQYVMDGHFRSTTKFVTVDVTDLYSMIARQGALEALMRFFEKHSDHGKIGSLAIDHIMRMARLILDTNCFAYNNKYYKQCRGGAMGSAFTQVLANIYMYEWEQHLMKHQEKHNGIYGR
ncbi:unnamed protein product, partial [Rotaria sordida]